MEEQSREETLKEGRQPDPSTEGKASLGVKWCQAQDQKRKGKEKGQEKRRWGTVASPSGVSKRPLSLSSGNVAFLDSGPA